MAPMRLEIWRTTDGSWAMNRYVRPSSCCMSSSMLTTWDWMDTSRAGDGLVADDELGLDCQGAGDAHALLLAAGELVGIAVCVLGVQAHHAQQLFDPVGALGL